MDISLGISRAKEQRARRGMRHRSMMNRDDGSKGRGVALAPLAADRGRLRRILKSAVIRLSNQASSGCVPPRLPHSCDAERSERASLLFAYLSPINQSSASTLPLCAIKKPLNGARGACFATYLASASLRWQIQHLWVRLSNQASSGCATQSPTIFFVT